MVELERTLWMQITKVKDKIDKCTERNMKDKVMLSRQHLS